MEFEYIIEKIKNANFNKTPFLHLEITNFLNPEHLNIILNDDAIHFEEQENIDSL